MKRKLASLMEWTRIVVLAVGFYLAYFGYFGKNAASAFHILTPLVVITMCSTVAFESLFLGEAASEKIGYKPTEPTKFNQD